MVSEGNSTAQTLRHFIDEYLAPTLNYGDVVVCDNAAVHDMDYLREVCAHHGATLEPLPPYFPELNPIELMVHAIG